ncbi:MAG TPA: cupin, partial [Arthrobacter sp.]
MSVNAENLTHASVAAGLVVPEPTPEEAVALERLYADFQSENLVPLWTQIGDLMPMVPSPKAVPHVWRWDDLYPLAARAGDLVPVGRGG